IKYLERFKDRYGNERLYFRNRRGGGKRVALRGPVGSPEFWDDYNAAASTPENASTDPTTTLRWLVNQYYNCAAFKQLGKRTRYFRKRLLEAFCKVHGGKRYRQLEPRHLRMIRDQRTDTPGQMNNTLKALRQVFKYAVNYDLARYNPVIEVEHLKPKSKSGIHTWTLEEVERFESHNPIGTKARLVLDLLLYTAQRRGDIVKMGRQHERDGWLHFTQEKTGKRMSLPIVPTLRQTLDASPTGDMTYIVTQFNKPFTSDGFGKWFRKCCDEVGLKHCSAHGLRKASAVKLAHAGATAHEIASITGHDTLKEVERYTKEVEQQHLAESAAKLLEVVK
ncbi:MAG: tyrosine-type recombinase/integrase, partial [Chloroflexi bacterium]|nr:tyrosine-type recombinase/integrase [Chloroflexota bacterium]